MSMTVYVYRDMLVEQIGELNNVYIIDGHGHIRSTVLNLGHKITEKEAHALIDDLLEDEKKMG